MNVTMFNSRRPPAEEEAINRQEEVRMLHNALTGATNGLRNVPIFLKVCLQMEIWKRDRIFAGGTRQEPIPFHDFVHCPYPVGLGADYDTLRGFSRDDIELLALFDRASQRPDGGANNPHGRAGKPDVITLHNVQGDNDARPAPAPTGNAAQAALRRLEKAVADGVIGAWALQAEVLQGLKSPHAAMIELGFRKRTVTVADSADALTNAAMNKAGPVETAMRVWRKMTESERHIFTQWIDEQAVR